MKVLALDTSTQTASVALFDDRVMIAETCINHHKTHSQKLMPILQNLMNSVEWKVKDVNLIAVAVGPGSFTGIRIGISVAKALAQPFNIPIFPVSSLEGMCYSFNNFDGFLCPMFDARRTQVYAGVYKYSDEKVKSIYDESCILIADLLEIIEKDRFFENNIEESFVLNSKKNFEENSGLISKENIEQNININKNIDGNLENYFTNTLNKDSEKIFNDELSNNKILFMGDAAVKFSSQIIESLGDRAVFAPCNLIMPKASAIAMAALYKDKSEYKRYDTIKANYLRLSEAEINLIKY